MSSSQHHTKEHAFSVVNAVTAARGLAYARWTLVGSTHNPCSDSNTVVSCWNTQSRRLNLFVSTMLGVSNGYGTRVQRPSFDVEDKSQDQVRDKYCVPAAICFVNSSRFCKLAQSTVLVTKGSTASIICSRQLHFCLYIICSPVSVNHFVYTWTYPRIMTRAHCCRQ